MLVMHNVCMKGMRQLIAELKIFLWDMVMVRVQFKIGIAFIILGLVFLGEDHTRVKL